MVFTHRVSSNRPDLDLDEGQQAACGRAERGHKLTEVQRGALATAAIFANRVDARRAQDALDLDQRNRNGQAGRR